LTAPNIVIIGLARDANVGIRARRLSEAAELVIVEPGPDVSFATRAILDSEQIGAQGRRFLTRSTFHYRNSEQESPKFREVGM